MLPIGPIAQFTQESRRALFSASMEAAAKQDTDGLRGYLAAHLARSPSIATFITQSNVDLTAILKAMKSDPVPENATDTMPAGIDLPQNLVRFWNELETNLANAPEQSVTPAQVLLLLLEYDPGVRATFEKHGFNVSRFRDSVPQPA